MIVFLHIKTGNQIKGEMVMSQVLYLSMLLEWSVHTLERQSKWLKKGHDKTADHLLNCQALIDVTF